MKTPEEARQGMINRLTDKEYTQKVLTKYNNYDSIDTEDVELDEVDFDEWDENKHFRAPDGKFAERGGGASIKVDGPAKAKSYVQNYLQEHPDKAETLKKSAEQCKNVLNSVKNFQQEHPNAEDGTYSAITGDLVNFDDGYSVTFHQNHSVESPYDDYDDDTYAYMCAITKEELGSDDVYIGYFGNAEVSFHCPDFKKASVFAIEHNQKSIWDNKMFKTFDNKYRNAETNPCADD